MLIIICGPSGAGKSELSKALTTYENMKEVVSYTTRSPRIGEKQGEDYYFVNNEVFSSMIEDKKFCEYEEYSQNRLYGTAKADVIQAAKSSDFYSVVMTPNGVRAIEKTLSENNVPVSSYLKVMIDASLGVRVKRYIDRVKADRFNFDDMNEINARVNRDFGMFLNMDKYCDLVLDNSADYRYDTSITVNAMKLLAEQVRTTFELHYEIETHVSDYQEDSERDW